MFRTRIGALVLTGLCLLNGTCLSSSVHARGVVVPAYFKPSFSRQGPDPWKELARTARGSSVEIIAVMNPHSGPGLRPDLGYMYATGRFKRAGGKLFGYVRSTYGTRPLSEMKKEIDAYFYWYGVDGIFVDEAPRRAEAPEVTLRLSALQDYVKQWDSQARVLQNHGTDVADELMPTAELHCIYENGVNNHPFREQWRASPGQRKHARGRFVAMVYGIEELEDAIGAIEHAGNQHVGYLYVTDDRPLNPWDQLPSYWESWISSFSSL